MNALNKIKTGINNLGLRSSDTYDYDLHHEMADLMCELDDGFEGTDDQLAAKFDANIGELSAAAVAAYLSWNV